MKERITKAVSCLLFGNVLQKNVLKSKIIIANLIISFCYLVAIVSLFTIGYLCHVNHEIVLNFIESL
jgi:hypothetical protein